MNTEEELVQEILLKVSELNVLFVTAQRSGLKVNVQTTTFNALAGEFVSLSADIYKKLGSTVFVPYTGGSNGY